MAVARPDTGSRGTNFIYPGTCRRQNARHPDGAGLAAPSGGHGPVPADHVRFAHFCELRDALDVALTSRVGALGYKEVSSLWAVLAQLNTMLTNLSLQERKTLPLGIANSLRENLLELDWLALPHEYSQR